MKPAHSGTARTFFFPPCRKVPFHPGTWILDPWNCKTFPIKTIFRYPQVPFKTGFAVFISIFIRKCTLMSALSCHLLTGALRLKTYVQSLNLGRSVLIRQVFGRQNYLLDSARMFDDVFRKKDSKVLYWNVSGSHHKACVLVLCLQARGGHLQRVL